VPPFNDERVRQGVYAALDIKDLIQRVELGEGEWSGPVPPYLDAWALPADELKRAFPGDAKKARDLLTAAGFANYQFHRTNSLVDGILAHRGG